MKTEEELNKEILETTRSIHEHYPELSKFEDEMTVTIPDKESPEINASTLKDFNDSLQAMAQGYAHSATKHIVIIGAGFAGLKIARSLNNNLHYRITLIDKNNYHQFQPLFYQVAMANLDASNISFPLRNIFEKSKNVRIRVEAVTAIHCESNTLETEKEQFRYDYLVIATGATTNYFGNSAIQEHTFPMKSTFEALQIRNTLLQHFEDAVATKTADTEKLLSVVIVGGGPTGVELSGALAEMKNDSLPFEYPELDFTKMNIYLLEGTSKLLANMSEVSSKKAQAYLTKLGVIVKTAAIVKEYDGHTLLLQDKTELQSTFVIWAAGVKGNIPPGINPEQITKTNQIKTDVFNRVVSFKNVFAVGDIAFMETDLHPKGFPQLASVAIDQAENVAANFIRLATQKPMLPYKYSNKGSMATIGRNKAVVDLATPKLSFQGFFAWIIWMTLHLFLLIGFKNRIVVFVNWMYKYVTHRQSLALLFPALTVKNKK
ncbi:MAG: FAD-dependent oxidoreductase [Flavobacterium sp. BFFFF2]|nr:MAG: FAD-dependent oxidoreductase [Flavobacterium sp. BFFFF2]